ncbi:hypothetical protein RKE38_10320 [Phycicoccus sp. M110.8]|uniref:hypothetical protein n=1 Tax=Phycicoccus sp. M110.8 TaxID=3075433 RepID=UPI0028FDA9D2|nr:hypothetical protein [Phycicoccus sp. M110.8]MDU0314079.1 hypothetical protein [Phycicoccus sp. M110.8]
MRMDAFWGRTLAGVMVAAACLSACGGGGSAATPTLTHASTAASTATKSGAPSAAAEPTEPSKAELATMDVEAAAIAKRKGGRDPRAGSDPSLDTAEPKLALDDNLSGFSRAEQRDALEWLNDFMRRSTYDMKMLPVTRDPADWASEMTPAVHQAFAAQVKANKATWGFSWRDDQKRFIRAEPLRNYTMKVLGSWRYPGEHPGMQVLVYVDIPYTVYAGAPHQPVDVRGHWSMELVTAVVPGGPLRWRLARWRTNHDDWIDD